MLPWALSAPLAGVIVDRYNRRRLMVGMNLVRAVVVLGFLLIDQPADVPWLYALLTGQVVAGAVFNPAKSAALPNITTPRELLTANALMSATWSTMLAVGAALGGEPSRRWAPMPPSGSTAGRTSSRPSSSWEPPFRRTLIQRTRRFSGPLSARWWTAGVTCGRIRASVGSPSRKPRGSWRRERSSTCSPCSGTASPQRRWPLGSACCSWPGASALEWGLLSCAPSLPTGAGGRSSWAGRSASVASATSGSAFCPGRAVLDLSPPSAHWS